jgi:hypothetical protein
MSGSFLRRRPKNDSQGAVAAGAELALALALVTARRRFMSPFPATPSMSKGVAVGRVWQPTSLPSDASPCERGPSPFSLPPNAAQLKLIRGDGTPADRNFFNFD